MANENWVGFAKSPKPDPNKSRLVVSQKISFEASVERVFGLVTSAKGLSTWLHKVEASEVRTSGKIKFADVAEDLQVAVFSLVEIGRKVVMNSELYGELAVVFDKRDSRLEISFTKMVTSPAREVEKKNFELAISNFANRVGEIS